MDLSSRNHASARGGQRANTGTFRVPVSRVDLSLAVWSIQARQLMRATGATAEQAIAFARSKGSLTCTDEDITYLVEMLKK